MAMKRCPECGEKYSDTYRNCPFCEEEEALRDGEEIRRSAKRGRRAPHGRQYSLITPTLIVLILIMAGLLIYLLYGDKIAAKLDKDGKDDGQQTEDVIDPVEPMVGGDAEGDTGDGDGEQDGGQDNDGTMPEDGGTTTAPTASASDYETIMALPGGLGLSTTDFTLKTVGETASIRVTSGGSGTYTWASEDESVATVDQSGKVTAVSRGTVNVVVSDGSKKGVCIVRCSLSGSTGTGTTGTTGTGTTGTGTTGTTGTTATGSGLKAGAATVVNGGGGVFVRSGPGTSYEALATVTNGADIQIVESAGDGWYKISFSDVGGVTTTGYMKGDYLANK